MNRRVEQLLQRLYLHTPTLSKDAILRESWPIPRNVLPLYERSASTMASAR